jgi:hypothetical protein
MPDKSIAPGVVCDLVVPRLPRGSGVVAWSLVGGPIGAARLMTIFVVTLIVQAPGAVSYALLKRYSLHRCNEPP